MFRLLANTHNSNPDLVLFVVERREKTTNYAHRWLRKHMLVEKCEAKEKEMNT